MRGQTFLMRLLAGAALTALIFSASAWSQEDVENVRDSVFTETMRPAAVFPHDAHNAKAGIGDCAVCHHVVENGRPVEGETSEDRECSECHHGGKGWPMDVVRAYHQRCRGCHVERKAGPVTCAGCHPRR
jgi:hypothetical protein